MTFEKINERKKMLDLLRPLQAECKRAWVYPSVTAGKRLLATLIAQLKDTKQGQERPTSAK